MFKRVRDYVTGETARKRRRQEERTETKKKVKLDPIPARPWYEPKTHKKPKTVPQFFWDEKWGFAYTVPALKPFPGGDPPSVKRGDHPAFRPQQFDTFYFGDDDKRSDLISMPEQPVASSSRLQIEAPKAKKRPSPKKPPKKPQFDPDGPPQFDPDDPKGKKKMK